MIYAKESVTGLRRLTPGYATKMRCNCGQVEENVTKNTLKHFITASFGRIMYRKGAISEAQRLQENQYGWKRCFARSSCKPRQTEQRQSEGFAAGISRLALAKDDRNVSNKNRLPLHVFHIIALKIILFDRKNVEGGKIKLRIFFYWGWSTPGLPTLVWNYTRVTIEIPTENNQGIFDKCLIDGQVPCSGVPLYQEWLRL